MVDKKEIKELANNLYFDIDDKLVEKIIDYLKDATDNVKKFEDLVDESVTPANYPRVVNCAKLRKDVPVVNKENKDYLSNAKVADKYVVGK